MWSTGAFAGNNPADTKAFQSWLGRPLDWVGLHTGGGNWTDWLSSITWLSSQYKELGARFAYSIPMFATGATLSQAASGALDSHYVEAAKALIASQGSSQPIYIRFGEEFNGNWMPWSAQNGQAGNYIQAYHHFVDAFRSVSDNFKFEWNVNLGDVGMNPATAYPGDAYVDIVAMDFYYNTQWDSKDPIQAWNYNVTRPYGLQWLEDFAKAHGKPTAYSEWSVNSDMAGPYIEKAYQWFADHNVVYENYWNEGFGFNGTLTGGALPNAAQTYIDAFGASPSFYDTTKLILGGSGADVLFGTSGADAIDGSRGADTMSGGLGNDTYYVDNVNDVIIEQSWGGSDTVITSVTYTLASDVNNLILRYSDNIDGYGNDLSNLMTGNGGNNYLNGKGGADTISGEAGNDTLVGGDGKDILSGGAGDDIIYGSAGDDRIIGDAGIDNLYGGSGSDTFVFSKGSGIDFIQDFDKRYDHIQLDPGASYTLSWDGHNTTVDISAADHVVLLGSHVSINEGLIWT